ncbi:MAG: AarF/UbiB family protein [Proteobacteria bacterium]|nr:AarF/UbiB family protein [Pseudomonadota bacterium]
MRDSISKLGRLGVIVQTLMRHGLWAVVDQLGLADRNLVTRPTGKERGAARFGRRLSLALNDLGPTFVKLGQILSTREDMLPPAIVRELEQLQDNARPVATRAVRKEIQRSLGQRIGELYSFFDDEPLAAGSIGQVHRARTQEGDEVVVKVRRPGIEAVVESDLQLLLSVAEMAANRSADIARHDPVGFVEEFGRSLKAELDFVREAEFMDRMRAEVGGTAYVPRVYAELSTESVMTVEYVEAVKVTAIDGDGVRRRLARQVVACFATQFLRNELFHADPHAGNVVQRSDGELVLFDMGAIGTLDPTMRRTLHAFSVAAGECDGDGAAEALLQMVHVPADLEKARYRQDMGDFLAQLLGRPLAEANYPALIRQGLEVTRQHGLRLRTEYFLLLRATILVDGVLRSLDPDIDPIKATRSYILRSWFTREWFPLATKLVFGTVWARLTGMFRRKRRPPPALPEKTA